MTAGTGGSSPLARGLLRALRTQAQELVDHPRSRGVYQPRARHEAIRQGSSPLARGLRAMSSRRTVTRGIIPARAGFTKRGYGAGRVSPDHPRSRGVYPGERTPRRKDPGSSPLARGLLRGAPQDQPVEGIIPARAGFTRRPRRPPVPAGDHPRSRGVYHDPNSEAYSTGGSSPLARGLRAIWGTTCAPGRIIPARAGFTRSCGAPGCRGLDHPRSRGVYAVAPPGGLPRPVDHPRSRGVYAPSSRCRGPTSGSSPLARGLRHAPVLAGRGSRIIPARAGFTQPSQRAHFARADHPRSRGVYLFLSVRVGLRAGSSPLARGLLLSALVVAFIQGIIPARAGFTRRPGGSSAPGPGSSPLARGLHQGRGGDGDRMGIIPARAGFTAGRGGRGGRRADHPRSRGVYWPGPWTGAASSWIIPARAGFTPPLIGSSFQAEDHPRSRGVYTPRPGRRPSRTGSSPLARGLQGDGQCSFWSSWIIPARAGFTG